MDEHALPERKAFLEGVDALLGRSDYLTALGLAESRLKQAPGDMDARMAIARVWIEQGRLEEAGEMLREMEEILAGLSQIYTTMGDIYLKKGMLESAQAFYRTYLSLNPETPTALEVSEKLQVIPRQQATVDGLAAKEEAASQIPDGLKTVTLAELYARQGHLRMAEEMLEAILNRGPHHPKAAELLREVRLRIATQEEPGAIQARLMPGDADDRIAIPDKPEERTVPERTWSGGERIVDQERPGEKREAGLIRELERLHERLASRESPGEKHATVIAELSRWLNNIGRLSSHAA